MVGGEEVREGGREEVVEGFLFRFLFPFRSVSASLLLCLLTSYVFPFLNAVLSSHRSSSLVSLFLSSSVSVLVASSLFIHVSRF